MKDQNTQGGRCAPVSCSATVYSGPHYGRTHKIIKRTEALVWVEFRGDKFAVPYCDVECNWCRVCKQPVAQDATSCASCGATDFET